MPGESPLTVTEHATAASPSAGARPSFFYDLDSPECYLAAERVTALLPGVAEWVPVDEPALRGALAGSATPAAAGGPDARRAAVEALAAARGLPPLRWPPRWPAGDVQPARLTAAYARQVSRVVAFSLAALRQAFAAGRDLGDVDAVLIAAAACELHPNAVLRALERAAVAAALAGATRRALALGVRSLPAFAVGGRVLHGDGGIDELAGARP